jgi:hypothetical protein
MSGVWDPLFDHGEGNLATLRLASPHGTGTRFISDLENGKATIELGKVAQEPQFPSFFKML